jgi:hypothetical protein
MQNPWEQEIFLIHFVCWIFRSQLLFIKWMILFNPLHIWNFTYNDRLKGKHHWELYLIFKWFLIFITRKKSLIRRRIFKLINLFILVLGIKSRTLWISGKCFATLPYPQQKENALVSLNSIKFRPSLFFGCPLNATKWMFIVLQKTLKYVLFNTLG